MQSVLRSSLLSRHGFSHGFSTRSGGVSPAPFESLNLGRSVGDAPEHVAENHRRFAARVGYEPVRIFELSQVHGRRARQVEAHEDASEVRREEGDALLTAAAGVAIGVRAADCLPLLIGDPATGAVAAELELVESLVAGPRELRNELDAADEQARTGNNRATPPERV